MVRRRFRVGGRACVASLASSVVVVVPLRWGRCTLSVEGGVCMRKWISGLFVAGMALIGTASAQFVASFDLGALATQAEGDIANVFTVALPVMIAATALIVAWRYAKRVFRGV